jgi:hypothetical protein
MSISRILGRPPTRPSEETKMHPTISYWLAQARIADLHHQARRDTLPSALRRARHFQRKHVAPTRPIRELERKP